MSELNRNQQIQKPQPMKCKVAAHADNQDVTEDAETLHRLHVACHKQPESALWVLERMDTQLRVLQRNGGIAGKAFVISVTPRLTEHD